MAPLRLLVHIFLAGFTVHVSKTVCTVGEFSGMGGTQRTVKRIARRATARAVKRWANGTDARSRQAAGSANHPSSEAGHLVTKQDLQDLAIQSGIAASGAVAKSRSQSWLFVKDLLTMGVLGALIAAAKGADILRSPERFLHHARDAAVEMITEAIMDAAPWNKDDDKAEPLELPDQITALRRAIIGQESNGNFKAVNPHSGALGYGQVMPANVPSWTEQALGVELTTDEFLSDRTAQLTVIDHKLSEYWSESAKVTQDESEIVRRVASKWYSGRSELWDNTNPQPYNGHEYPSVANYTKSVLNRYNTEIMGEMVFPVAGLTYAENETRYPSGNNDFGPRISQPTLNGSMTSSFHRGYDAACAIGTPNLAAWPGTITQSGTLGGYGLTVTIEHPNKYQTIYAHNNKLLVREGDRVAAGDPISLCGQTGNSTGPHLHFAIKDPNGNYIDPEPFLEKL